MVEYTDFTEHMFHDCVVTRFGRIIYCQVKSIYPKTGVELYIYEHERTAFVPFDAIQSVRFGFNDADKEQAFKNTWLFKDFWDRLTAVPMTDCERCALYKGRGNIRAAWFRFKENEE